jgi:hypothetical protein
MPTATRVNGTTGTASLDGTELSSVTAWSADLTSDIETGAHSGSSGWEEATPTVKKWSGTMTIDADEGKMNSAAHTAWAAGTIVAFVGTATTGVTYTGNMYITSPGSPGVDIATGAKLVHEIAFTGSGPLTPSPLI